MPNAPRRGADLERPPRPETVRNGRDPAMTARHRRNTEPYVNGIVARALDRRHPLWKAGSEQTRTIAGQPGKRPDILLEHRSGGRSSSKPSWNPPPAWNGRPGRGWGSPWRKGAERWST